MLHRKQCVDVRFRKKTESLSDKVFKGSKKKKK